MRTISKGVMRFIDSLRGGMDDICVMRAYINITLYHPMYKLSWDDMLVTIESILSDAD